MRAVRQRIVNAALGALASKTHWNYAEIRPIPFATFNALMNGEHVEITTDCSGLATCCYQRAGAPNPNGGPGYDDPKQTMYTGTMLTTLPAIPLTKAQPGDLAVFGVFPGKHVVVIVGTGPDPTCISHGGQGDPKAAPLSHFSSIGPLTVLKGVSVITPTPKKGAVDIVSGNDGQKISHTRHRRIWVMRHGRLMRKHRERLHFDRVSGHPDGATNPPADEEK